MKEINKIVSTVKRDAKAGSREAAERFAATASDLGLVDVAYAILDSPVGQLGVAVTPRGLALITFGTEHLDETLEDLGRLVSPRILRMPSRLDPVRKELDEYFEGRRTRFELPVDLRLATTEFRRKVLRAASRVPYGRVATYRDLAQRSGSPRAVRAVGSALGANPVPIVVPCHRILRTGGGLGGYGGGLKTKQFLLDLEAGQ